MRRVYVPVLLVAVVASAALTRELRTRSMDHYLATQRYEDVYYVPPKQWLPLFSLGHDEALGALLWLRALVYFGEEIHHRGGVEHVFHYADAILTLAPEFRKVYRWAGMAGMYHTGEVSTDEIKEAISFLERGVRRFPDDGAMAWDLGASLAFELVPHLDDEDEKRRIQEQATEHLQVAARLGGAPEWLVFTNATQLRRLGRTEQAIRHLEEMYSTVRNPETRAQIAIELETLRSRSYAEAFRQAHEEHERSRRRDFPYVSPSLYLLLGQRPVVDPYAVLRGERFPEERTVDIRDEPTPLEAPTSSPQDGSNRPD